VCQNFETTTELAKRVGVPVANIRHLIRDGALEHIFLTPAKRNPKIPQGAWERYVEKFTVKDGQDPNQNNTFKGGR
jgi:hypothetical protein